MMAQYLRFGSLISHEFRNPLGILASQLSLLSREHAQGLDHIDKRVEVMERATRRLLQMFDKWLKSSRLVQLDEEFAPHAIPLQQWLRLDTARQWLATPATADAPSSGSGANAAERLMHETVSLGGYPITPRWAAELRAFQAPTPAAGQGHWVWLECQGAPAPPSVAAQHHAAAVADEGWKAQALAVQAPSFWLNHGTQDAPALLAATLEAMQAP